MAASSLCAGGCTASEDGDPAGVIAGAACDPSTPCAAGLLCLDQVCTARVSPGPDGPAPPGPITIVPARPDVTNADTGPAGPDANDTGASADADASPGDVIAGDLGGDVDANGTLLVTVGTHEAVDRPSADRLTLQAGQAAVSEIAATVSGAWVGVEVLANDAVGSEACALYRPVVWVATGVGAFDLTPTWRGATFEVAGSEVPQELPISGGPDVPAGFVRFGLEYVGLCAGYLRQPLLVTDDSGITERTWVWASTGDSGTWIGATTLGLHGRWAIRATLRALALP